MALLSHAAPAAVGEAGSSWCCGGVAAAGGGVKRGRGGGGSSVGGESSSGPPPPMRLPTALILTGVGLLKKVRRALAAMLPSFEVGGVVEAPSVACKASGKAVDETVPQSCGQGIQCRQAFPRPPLIDHAAKHAADAAAGLGMQNDSSQMHSVKMPAAG